MSKLVIGKNWVSWYLGFYSCVKAARNAIDFNDKLLLLLLNPKIKNCYIDYITISALIHVSIWISFAKSSLQNLILQTDFDIIRWYNLCAKMWCWAFYWIYKCYLFSYFDFDLPRCSTWSWRSLRASWWRFLSEASADSCCTLISSMSFLSFVSSVSRFLLMSACAALSPSASSNLSLSPSIWMENSVTSFSACGQSIT